MLGNNETNSIVSWSTTGTSFVINNPHSFAANVLPIYFRHRNFQSFVTQLNSYGFKKISWEQWEYRNDNFRRGERHLLRNIKRRNQQIPHRNHPSSQTEPFLTTSSCSSLAEKELEITMKEHDLLKLEITKLKEKQGNLEQKLKKKKKQAFRNRNDQQRMMFVFVAQRIIGKQKDHIQIPDEKNLKEKRKMEEKSPLMCTDSGNIPMVNIVEMISEHFTRQGETALDEEDQMGKDQSNMFISLEDLIGESSDWVEYVRELQEKASQIKS
ncbi:hypothetical protein CDL12_08762 [Handroanthus impetiginosus]|uniref:HSF-type DNA-binding domain-containing protein n=1 Tax=Handroanthus impetiginosus TaxID=429701 RepID=A0A2G9HMB2_9LAMI|nr:hypothetical protein CDL12_08762 [Handroanthus impetiginosus]